MFVNMYLINMLYNRRLLIFSKIGILALRLVTQMEIRTTKLFAENMALGACIFLDPRLKHLLKSYQKSNVIEHLCLLYERITTASSEF